MYRTSRSIYVVYSTISAAEIVGPDEHVNTVGGIYYDITRAYLPYDLQTMPAACYHQFGTYKVIKVEDLINPPQNWIVDQQCGMVMGHPPDGSDFQFPNPNGTEEAAVPNLSLPADMSTYDPLWSGCSQFPIYYPVWDPPRALTPASVMAPLTTPHQMESPSSTADPGLGPADPLPVSRSVAAQNTPKESIDPGASPLITQSASVISGANNNAGEAHVVPGDGADSSQVPDFEPSGSSPYPPPLNGQDVQAENGGGIAKGDTISAPSITPPPLLPFIGNQKVSEMANGAIAVGDSTISQGSQATFSNTPISVGSSFVVVGGSTFGLAGSGLTGPPPLIGGQTIQRASGGDIIIGTRTLSQGSRITISATPVYALSDGIVVDGTSYQLPTATGKSIKLNGLSVESLPDGDVIVDGHTLSIDAQTTVSGIVVSVGTNSIMVDGTLYQLPTATRNSSDINSQYSESTTVGNLIVDGQTLNIDAQTTVLMTPISVGSDYINIGGTTYHLPSATRNPLTTNGQDLERLPNGDVVVDGHTLGVGAQTTVSGYPVSIGATEVVFAGSTYELDQPTSSTNAIGAMINSMLGFVPPSTTGTLAPARSTSTGPANLSNSSSSLISFMGMSSSLDVNMNFLSSVVTFCIIAGVLTW